MNWAQLILLILQLLKQFQGNTPDEFAAFAQDRVPNANGDLLRWLWENRQEVVDFIKMLIEMMNRSPAVLSSDVEEIKSLLAQL